MSTSPNGGGGRGDRFTREAGFDWAGIEESPEFRELAARRRRFIARASIFFLAFFLTYLLLTAFAQEFMATEIAEMPLAFVLAVRGETGLGAEAGADGATVAAGEERRPVGAAST